jgi:hypothetical protein
MESIIAIVFSIFLAVLEAIYLVGYFALTHSTEVVLGGLCTTGAYVCIRYVFDIRVRLHPATRATWDSMVLYFQQESMFSDEPSNVVVGVGSTDQDLFVDPECMDLKRVRSHRRVSYAVRVAHLAKAQVGLLSKSKANELVYARICRDEMVKHGVRPSHIAHLCPLAVAACFIPLDSDILADSIGRCTQMKERASLLRGGHHG